MSHFAHLARNKIKSVNLDFVRPTVALVEPSVVKRTDKGTVYTGYSHLPMGDWDWADAAHKAADSITIRDLGDLTQNFMDIKPKGNYQLYLTPGGVHAFDLSSRENPLSYFARPDIQALNIDPNYSKLSVSSSMGQLYTEPNSFGSFNVRVSAKPERIEKRIPDWVGFPIGRMSFTDEPINPRSLRELSEHHDSYINDWMAKDLSQRAAALEAVRQRMATVSPSVRKMWGYE
jgi:hypothetical protein